ncbi:MAG: hypothetical protein AAF619_12070 [Pseudomonadota bacterium]
MPLQNRVLPDGSIVAIPDRGGWMGNRGGRIHDPKTRTLHPSRRWASKRWITCKLSFKNRQRAVMGRSYTELFFFDEAVSFAAGHRPCFECRRDDATAFQQALKAGGWSDVSADTIDQHLHAERTSEGKTVSVSGFRALPVGTMARLKDGTFACVSAERSIVRWSWSKGYHQSEIKFNQSLQLLTPLSVIMALENGYQMRW